MPYQQHFYNGATLFMVVRTATDPTALGPSIQRKARERSPEVSVRLTTLNALLAEHVATPKFRAWLLSLFGAVALCLAMAGVYGVMAFVAGQRSKEIAVRMALGAGARSVCGCAQPRIEDHRHRAQRRRAWRHRIHAPRQRHAISSPAT